MTRVDVNAEATHQEMRTYVCAQCHVEYYSKEKRSACLALPFDHRDRGAVK